ncbi:MAG TPA: ABC transporter permease [Thermotogaceae bacterium]|nr:ABC transporter permease [Thermotogaceae bacterium]
MSKQNRAFRELGPLVALIALGVFTAILNPRFLSIYNLQTLGKQAAIFGIMAIGETFVIMSGGGSIDLSPGSMVALIGIVSTYMIVHGIPVFIAILVSLGLSILIGLWHGFFVNKLKVPAFIITLGTLTIARGMAAVITKGWPIVGLPKNFVMIAQGDVVGFPIPVIILFTVLLITHFVLEKTVYGKHLRATGGNEVAARFSGVKVEKVRYIAFVVSAFLSGLVGIIVAARLSQGQPGVGGTYELYAIASAVIGGTSLSGGEGSALGAVIGAGIISLLWNALVMLNVSTYWHNVIIGAVIVIAVTLDILRKKSLARSK